MPQIGERQRNSKSQEFVWHACEGCGKERWVIVVRGQPRSPRCRKCQIQIAGTKRKPDWQQHRKSRKPKGRKPIYKEGYVFLYRPKHPRANNKGYVKRAILILEAILGRYMKAGMHSHHRNCVKDDDHPDNLMELTNSEHRRIHEELKNK